MIELKVKAVPPLMGVPNSPRPPTPPPVRRPTDSVRLDPEEPVTLAPGGRQGIPTGIAIVLSRPGAGVCGAGVR